MTSRLTVNGYLPQDWPEWRALLSLAAQHVLTMFPATTLVAVLTHFDVAVTLFAAGLATAVALAVSFATRRTYIPLWYGSSFSFIIVVKMVVEANGADGVRVAQVGILAAALFTIFVGLVVGLFGKQRLDRYLPPIVTGSIAMVIGFALAYNALRMAAGVNVLPEASPTWWLVAMVTLLVTIFASVYLRGRGLLGMLPILIGAATGYVVSAFFGLVNLDPVREAAWFAVPHFTMPAFGHPSSWFAVMVIVPAAIAVIPESTAHLYQLGLYVDRLAERQNREKPQLSRFAGLNLVLNGLADVVTGSIGGTAGTNYGENNSLMAITQNFSGPVILIASAMAMALGFVGKLSALVGSIPEAVTGGLAIYLFGVIGLQGVALIKAEKVDLFDPRQLALGATIMVIGIGGSVFPNSMIPLGSWNVPAIAAAAAFGILLNLVFVLFPMSQQEQVEETLEYAPSTGAK